MLQDREVQEMVEHMQEYFHEVSPVCLVKGQDKHHQDAKESPEMPYNVLSDDEDMETSKSAF